MKPHVSSNGALDTNLFLLIVKNYLDFTVCLEVSFETKIAGRLVCIWSIKFEWMTRTWPTTLPFVLSRLSRGHFGSFFVSRFKVAKHMRYWISWICAAPWLRTTDQAIAHQTHFSHPQIFHWSNISHSDKFKGDICIKAIYRLNSIGMFTKTWLTPLFHLCKLHSNSLLCWENCT